jgi:hypothetical protein
MNQSQRTAKRPVSPEEWKKLSKKTCVCHNAKCEHRGIFSHYGGGMWPVHYCEYEGPCAFQEVSHMQRFFLFVAGFWILVVLTGIPAFVWFIYSIAQAW